jgi:HTH-type transcriptional regulator/antitoxin HigA
MSIRPVKNERDYDASLARIDELWGAKPGTPDGDELDVLLTLVHVYEQENHPVPPPSPIEAIRFVMDQRGLKQADLVPYLGSRSKVSEVLNGKRTLTLSMIRALHKAFDIPTDILVQEGSSFPEDHEDIEWSKFPAKEIIKRGLVSGFDPKSQAEEIVRTIFDRLGISTAYSYSMAACFRQGSRLSHKDDPYAIQAWIYQALLEAQETELATRPAPDIDNPGMLKRIAHLSVFDDGPVKAKEYLANKGIKLVVVPHYKRTYLDGAVLYGADGAPIIALTLRYDRIDNFWFTLLHELSHLILGHIQLEGNKCILDDLDLKSSLGEIEREADKSANDALIPGDMWDEHPAKTTAKLAHVRELARMADIHPAIIAGRVRFEKGNYRLLSRQVGHGEVRKHFFA